MSVTLRCPNCEEDLGKTIENPVDSGCGNCGNTFYNADGYIEDNEHLAYVKDMYPGKKLPKPDRDE